MEDSSKKKETKKESKKDEYLVENSAFFFNNKKKEEDDSHLELESNKSLLSSRSNFSQHFNSSIRKDEKIVLNWSNLNYNTLVKDPEYSTIRRTVYKEKVILQDVTGTAETGQMVAIMGPTGCGKTSLLNILAGRCPGKSQKYVQLSGNISVNGEKRDEEKFRSISAYVLQDDYLYPHLTVAETFKLAATFYLPEEISAKDRNTLVDAVITELGLNKARDTIIGDEKTRGVSGGERRRASIGVQLISNPAVLFLDEPTSGLDSFQAASVMESMKSMAENGRLVISVIHQPRSTIYNMFDKLLLLTEGRCAYYGDSKLAVDYFAKLGHVCPSAYNPSDYFLDLLSPDNRTPESMVESRNRLKYLAERYLMDNIHKTLQTDDLDTIELEKKKNLLLTLKDIKSIGAPQTLSKQLSNILILFWREWTEQRRDTFTLSIKATFMITMAFITGGIYSDIGFDQASIQNRFGLLFFIVIIQLFIPAIAVFNSFPKEKNIVNRERATKAYDALSYFIAKLLVEIPMTLVLSFTFSCIIYYLVGLRPAAFLKHFIISIYITVVGIVFGLAISAGASSSDMANAIGIPLLMINNQFGGFYIKVTSLPIVLDFFAYMSIVRWAFQALCINEFTHLNFTCTRELRSECILTGEQALETLAFANHTVAYALWGLSMCGLGYLVIGYVILVGTRPKYTDPGYTGKMYRKHFEVDVYRLTTSRSSTDSPQRPLKTYVTETRKTSRDALEADDNNNNTKSTFSNNKELTV